MKLIDRYIGAVRITEKALKKVLPLIREGVSERDIASELRRLVISLGADKFSFIPIIASGKRSALPHGRATGRKLKKGDLVVVDFGVVYGGVCSDLTRTYVVGKPGIKHRRLYQAIKTAQKKAISRIRPGVPASEVDSAARGYLKKKGLDRYFIHTTGHGLGRKIHEAPKISRGNNNPLREGMVLTVEPGVYFKGWGGLRVEDMVVVTKRGCTLLTSFPRSLSA